MCIKEIVRLNFVGSWHHTELDQGVRKGEKNLCYVIQTSDQGVRKGEKNLCYEQQRIYVMN